MAYVAAGSRKASYEVGLIIEAQARLLDGLGLQVRTGTDRGTETWFVRTASNPDIYSVTDAKGLGRRLVNENHRNPPSLSGHAFDDAASLATRLFGRDFQSWARFVLCWTKDACESEAELTADTGKTGFLITVADRAGIPVFNLKKPDARDRLRIWISAQPER